MKYVTIEKQGRIAIVRFDRALRPMPCQLSYCGNSPKLPDPSTMILKRLPLS